MVVNRRSVSSDPPLRRARDWPVTMVGRAAVLSLLALVVAGCATRVLQASRQMETCLAAAAPVGVTAESFAAALREAQRHSDEAYGSDCLVCAELIDRADEYILHVTSPIEGMLANTSAAITVSKIDGVVTSRHVWHSCAARITGPPRKPVSTRSDRVMPASGGG